MYSDYFALRPSKIKIVTFDSSNRDKPPIDLVPKCLFKNPRVIFAYIYRLDLPDG